MLESSNEMPGEILLVDDDPLVRTVVAEELSDHGFVTHVAANEKSAMAMMAARPGIELAIVDYCLPKPVGISLCREIAKKHAVAVALYTGHGELAGVRRGDDDIPILSKALRIDRLAVAIRDLLDGRRPSVSDCDLSSRVEGLLQKEARRETVRSVGRAMHSQFDGILKESVPPTLSDTVVRLFSGGGAKR